MARIVNFVLVRNEVRYCTRSDGAAGGGMPRQECLEDHQKALSSGGHWHLGGRKAGRAPQIQVPRHSEPVIQSLEYPTDNSNGCSGIS